MVVNDFNRISKWTKLQWQQCQFWEQHYKKKILDNLQFIWCLPSHWFNVVFAFCWLCNNTICETTVGIESGLTQRHRNECMPKMVSGSSIYDWHTHTHWIFKRNPRKISIDHSSRWKLVGKFSSPVNLLRTLLNLNLLKEMDINCTEWKSTAHNYGA